MQVWEEKIKYYNKPTQKKLKKIGTIAVGIVEATPIVWKNDLYRFEWKRNVDASVHTLNGAGFYHFVNMTKGFETEPFAEGYSFGSAYAENDKMYVVGTNAWGGDKLDLFISSDLSSWEKRNLYTFEKGWKIYNTSLCKGEDGYVLAVEIGGPQEVAGKIFTIVFMHSKDLIFWELLDTDKYIHTKERYSACPVIRYSEGFYYMIYLEEMPMYKFVPYIARSKDLSDWEIAPVNPVLFYDDNDRILANDFTEQEKEMINNSLNTNNSDVDLCEYNGKTIIIYSWGNQMGREFLAFAEYDGSMKEFFNSFF